MPKITKALQEMKRIFSKLPWQVDWIKEHSSRMCFSLKGRNNMNSYSTRSKSAVFDLVWIHWRRYIFSSFPFTWISSRRQHFGMLWNRRVNKEGTICWFNQAFLANERWQRCTQGNEKPSRRPRQAEGWNQKELCEVHGACRRHVKECSYSDNRVLVSDDKIEKLVS